MSPHGPLTQKIASFHHVVFNTYLISSCREQTGNVWVKLNQKRPCCFQKICPYHSSFHWGWTLGIIARKCLILPSEWDLIKIGMFDFCSLKGKREREKTQLSFFGFLFTMQFLLQFSQAAVYLCLKRQWMLSAFAHKSVQLHYGFVFLPKKNYVYFTRQCFDVYLTIVLKGVDTFLSHVLPQDTVIEAGDR